MWKPLRLAWWLCVGRQESTNEGTINQLARTKTRVTCCGVDIQGDRKIKKLNGVFACLEGRQSNKQILFQIIKTFIKRNYCYQFGVWDLLSPKLSGRKFGLTLNFIS